MSKVIDQNEILNSIRADGNSFHGLSDSDWNEIIGLINSVKPTDSKSKTEFPDFLSEDGFIEHFHVTSGKSNRKGYDITTKEEKMNKSHESFVENMSSIIPKDNSVSQHHTKFQREDDSIDNFHKSFKKCWGKHIKHLHNYSGNKHLSCFLISSDDVLSVYEPVNDGNGLCFGDLSRQDKLDFCLSYDFELLDYIYQYQFDVDYVIYFNVMRNYTEIIKVSNIPAIKDYLTKHKYELFPLILMEVLSTYGVHIPVSEMK